MKNLNLTLNKKKHKLQFILLFATISIMLIPVIISAQTRMGFSATLGGGLFRAQEKNLYLGISTDFYPEIGLHMDISLIKLGVRAGLIYRKETLFYGLETTFEYTMSFLPAQIEILLAPFDATQKNSFISPYGGILAGAFIAIGDNDTTLPAFSLVLGSELRVEPLIMYGDIRYTFASEDADWDSNAGGIMIVGGFGIRLGL